MSQDSVVIGYLFDIDGTLLLAGGAGTRGLNRVFADHYRIDNAMEGISCSGKTDPLIVEEVIAARLKRAATLEEVESILENYLPMLAEELAVDATFQEMHYARECIDWLEARDNVFLALATGNVQAAAKLKLDVMDLDLWPRFRAGGFGSDNKDRALLVKAAMEKTAAAAPRPIERFVVVGDTPRDIAAARANNIDVVAVTTGSYDAEALTDADAVYDSLESLLGFHSQIVTSPFR